MEDTKKKEVVLLTEPKRLNVSYNYKEQSITYTKTAIAVVNNPYTGQIEVAVQPYYTNDFGELVPLYSFEEDIQYQECLKIATKLMAEGKPILDDVDKYGRKMMKLKEMARKQADAYIREQLSTTADDISSGYTRNIWREDVVSSKEAQEMLEEYKKQSKAKKK